MRCYVYKGALKADHYLFLAQEFALLTTAVPESILNLMGELELVTSFELSPDRHLAQADPKQVIADIDSQGFYLQMPRSDHFAEEDRYFN